VVENRNRRDMKWRTWACFEACH